MYRQFIGCKNGLIAQIRWKIVWLVTMYSAYGLKSHYFHSLQKATTMLRALRIRIFVASFYFWFVVFFFGFCIQQYTQYHFHRATFIVCGILIITMPFLSFNIVTMDNWTKWQTCMEKRIPLYHSVGWYILLSLEFAIKSDFEHRHFEALLVSRRLESRSLLP